MSQRHTTQLPDPVYGSADTGPLDSHRLSLAAGDDGKLIHVHAGGVYIATSERNWRAIFAAIESLDIPIPSYRINFDDTEGTAAIEVTA